MRGEGIRGNSSDRNADLSWNRYDWRQPWPNLVIRLVVVRALARAWNAPRPDFISMWAMAEPRNQVWSWLWSWHVRETHQYPTICWTGYPINDVCSDPSLEPSGRPGGREHGWLNSDPTRQPPQRLGALTGGFPHALPLLFPQQHLHEAVGKILVLAG